MENNSVGFNDGAINAAFAKGSAKYSNATRAIRAIANGAKANDVIHLNVDLGKVEEEIANNAKRSQSKLTKEMDEGIEL